MPYFPPTSPWYWESTFPMGWDKGENHLTAHSDLGRFTIAVFRSKKALERELVRREMLEDLSLVGPL